MTTDTQTPTPIVDAAEPSKVDRRVEQWKQQQEQVQQRMAQLQTELTHLQQQAIMLDGALQAYHCFIEDTHPSE